MELWSPEEGSLTRHVLSDQQVTAVELARPKGFLEKRGFDFLLVVATTTDCGLHGVRVSGGAPGDGSLGAPASGQGGFGGGQGGGGLGGGGLGQGIGALGGGGLGGNSRSFEGGLSVANSANSGSVTLERLGQYFVVLEEGFRVCKICSDVRMRRIFLGTVNGEVHEFQ